MRVWAIVFLSCAMIGLAGCGYYRWQKPGASNADFKADQGVCGQAGTSSTAFNACMQQHGWSYLD